jgi:hypothetical protein
MGHSKGGSLNRVFFFPPNVSELIFYFRKARVNCRRKSCPRVACSSYWGRAYRSGPPGLLREAREGGHRASGGVASGRGLAVLSICYKFFYHVYSVFSPYYIWLCSPPPVESRTTSGKAPLQRGCRLIYTRNIHRDEILICLLEVG